MRDEATTDREQGIRFGRLQSSHPMHGDPDDQSPDDVDDGDHDTGDDVPFDEFHRTVHRSVELTFFGQSQAEIAGLVGIDDPAAHVGIDTHLFTGHRVQGETGSDFSDPLGTFGHDDELNDRDDQEDNAADDEVTSDDEVTEGKDDMPCIGMEQNLSGRRDFDSETEKRGDQK